MGKEWNGWVKNGQGFGFVELDGKENGRRVRGRVGGSWGDCVHKNGGTVVLWRVAKRWLRWLWVQRMGGGGVALVTL